jgi:cytochrome P450
MAQSPQTQSEASCPFAAHRAEGPAPVSRRSRLRATFDFWRRPIEALVDGARLGRAVRHPVLGAPFTVLSGPDAARLVRLDGEGPLTREGTFHGFVSETGVPVFAQEGPEHERSRELLRAGYSSEVLGAHLPAAGAALRTRVRGLRTRARTPMVPLCAELATRAVLTALTPIDLRDIIPDLDTFGLGVLHVVVGTRPQRSLRAPEYQLAKARVKAAVAAVVARHARGDAPAGGSMVDAFLEARTAEGAMLSADEVVGASLYALCGAATYVGPLASHLLFELTRDAALGDRVRAEVDAAWEAGPPDARRLRGMRTLRAAWFEALRRYPVVLGLGYRARRDFAFDGKRIRRGELVLVSAVPDHFDPERVSDPFRFDADRFADGAPGSLAPFGMAPRLCLAAGASELLTLAVVSSVLRFTQLELLHPSYRPETALAPLPQAPDGLPLFVRSLRPEAP